MRIALMICVVIVVALFLPIPRIVWGLGDLRDMTETEKYDTLTQMAERISAQFLDGGNRELVDIEIDAANIVLNIRLVETNEGIITLSREQIDAQFLAFNAELCTEMQATAIYLAGGELKIHFERPNGSPIGSLIVSERDCAA